MKASELLERMKETARKLKTSEIVPSIKKLDPTDGDHRIVRAVLLGIYEERKGEEAVDALVEALGI
jgi:hypothetical protein